MIKVTGNTVGSHKHLNSIQRDLVIGTILGDGYLQRTGEQKARLRIEHSEKQCFYVSWKYQHLKTFVSRLPVFLERTNSEYGRTYRYRRFQTTALEELGAFRQLFYPEGKKIIPENIQVFFKSPFSLAVWYMDDGYLYRKDRNIHIYLSRYSNEWRRV